jgi:hypothetical protein
MSTRYKIGTSDPTIGHDTGAGMWNSKPKTMKMRVLKSKIIEHLPFAYPVVGDDAVKHMYHYFSNSGIAYHIDLQDMVNDVLDARALYKDEVDSAKQFVNTLPVGIHNITTDTVAAGYNRKNQNWNWFYAVGGYSAWIKGIAKVEQDKSGKRKYRFDYEYKVVDRYNWDTGKQVDIFGVIITDKFMGEFHRQGMAKEFNMNGSIKTSIEWDSLNPSSHTVVSSPTGR